MNRDIRRMRPMGIADILDETVELYKTSFVLLVGIAAVVYVPYSIFERYYLTPLIGTVARPGPQNTPDLSNMFFLLGATAISYLYLMVATPFVTGAMTYAVSERFLGRRTTVLSSFKQVFSASVFGQLLLVVLLQTGALAIPMVIMGIVIFASAMAVTMSHAALYIAIPIAVVFVLGSAFAAAYLLLRLALVGCSVVVERRGIGHALSRTWTMMTGNMLKCFVLFFVAGLVTAIVSWVSTIPTQTLITTSMLRGGSASQVILIIHTIIGVISTTVLAPVMSIVTILLYYDIRIRKEGFDLELLASELDARTRQIGAFGAQPLPQEQVPAPQPTEQAPSESESSPQ